MIVGGCLAQLASDALKVAALNRGISADMNVIWPSDVNAISRELDKFDPQLMIYQPEVVSVLGPLFNLFFQLDDLDKIKRLNGIKNHLTEGIKALLEKTKGRLLLVQGLSSPQMPPDGRIDFRSPYSFSWIIRELNEHICHLLRENLNALFVDEERLVSNVGKRWLVDDMISSYGHHGPLDIFRYVGDDMAASPEFGDPNGVRLSQILADEYLDCYLLWSGRRKIKCVIVDLDNTFWRGTIGEDGPLDINLKGHCDGFHQALKILKSRGILLATCSKNDHDHAMEVWDRLIPAGNIFSLRPDDFAIHRINWKAKSANIEEIMQLLGLVQEDVLFIDDNAVERAEVQSRFPQMRLLGEDLFAVRRELLMDPGYQVNVMSHEAKTRTKLAKAQLRRDEGRTASADESSFLKSLGIKIEIEKVTTDLRIPRTTELFQRTNQFNTTLMRYDAETLKSLIERDDAHLYLASVSDRFAQYGIVGACSVVGSSIECIAISCRVMALQIAVPFISSVIEHARLREKGAIGKIAVGERNQPAQGIFRELGFAEKSDGIFQLSARDRLCPIDTRTYAVNFVKSRNP